MKRKNTKKIVISVVALVLVAAIGLGCWYYFGNSSSEPVNVYPFMYIGMTEYWGDSQESYGPVTTDKIQTVYLSDTQTVTEIHVAVGDTVQKGDLLMTFDTTLSDLALERERLEVEKLKLQLEDAKDYLKEIKGMKPMVIPQPSDDKDEDVNLGTAISGPYQISTQSAYDGSTQEKALICWIRSDVDITDEMLEAIRQKAEEFQKLNAEKEEPVPEETIPEETTRQLSAQTVSYGVQFLSEVETVPPTEIPTEPETEPTEMPTEPEVPPTEPEPELNVNKFYVVFKVTESDMSLGQTKVWQGMTVTQNANGFSFKLYDASFFKDHSMTEPVKPEEPEIDYGSGYTSAQLAQMRSEQEKVIKDLQFQIKMAEADYKIMQTEVSDGKVYADIDGQVVSVLTEEEAKMNFQPILKVSGGGGFYVQGSVSELEKDNLQIGQEVTVNDWNTGMVHTGIIQSVGDYPSSDGYWNGMGNPNASYYPFTVFIDGSVDLQEGTYVSVMYSSASAEQGIYLENPFLRTEQGKSYVFVMGEGGKLEKRYVTTGKALWGSYTEILDGLTAEDLIAFPYGKNVKDGAPAQESDISELYNYY